ncbi:MAG: ABC transporter permease [Candidatus Pacebacteria bacterium]|nr:ABC transporter permease [Candidatus Paceibacterota bacterium]
MHAKEKPDEAEIKTQNELYNAYDSLVRKSVKEDVTETMAKAAPLDRSAVDLTRGSTFGSQCRQLLLRAFRNLIRSPSFIQARIIQTIVVAIVLDILFFRKTGYGQQETRDKNSVLFFTITTQLMFTMESVILSCTPRLLISG